MPAAIRTFLALSAGLLANTAYADVCSSLQQQYVAAGSGGGNATTARGAVNVTALNNSLQIAEASAQSNHCMGGAFSFFGPQPSPACPLIMQEVNRLQGQIRQAYSNSGGGFGPFGGMAVLTPPRPSRDQIRGQLVAYGCPVPGDGGGYGYSSGGYRTVCVRVCDGYYFPIENGVSSDRFATDAQTCQTMYPGQGQAQLFVMPTDGDMANAQPVNGGKNYGSQPYAFAYRTDYNPECTGELQNGIQAMLSKVTAVSPATGPAKTATGTPIPLPQMRAGRFEDPETLANLAGDLHPQAIATAVAAASSGIAATSTGNIRVVGAAYYNDLLKQQTLAKAADGGISAAAPGATEPSTP